MQIRPTDPERDALTLVELMRETEPLQVMNAASWLHRERAVPERARLRAFVAELDGRVAGESWSLRAWFVDGPVLIHVAVFEWARGRGAGSALYDAAFAHAQTLAPTRLSSSFYETPAGVGFARARGFREARAEQLSSVDPREVREQPAAELRPASEVDPQVLYRIDAEATSDMPALEPHDIGPYEEWREHVFGHPLFQPEGSFVAYADGEPAALTLLTADLESGRATNNFTGTLRAFRGRGLGRAVKLGSLRWAATNGITLVTTTNDETNAPMLAINRGLGYRPAGGRVECVQEPER